MPCSHPVMGTAWKTGLGNQHVERLGRLAWATSMWNGLEDWLGQPACGTAWKTGLGNQHVERMRDWLGQPACGTDERLAWATSMWNG